ncbi:hypothetical protein LCGC14_2538200 [marine sediment metagenome]|uniref:Uncharacterized protein n=1 Tax=marine sediment metagenome TaxID=412755 RepID=A0A0F9AS14_9ZZZZ
MAETKTIYYDGCSCEITHGPLHTFQLGDHPDCWYTIYRDNNGDEINSDILNEALDTMDKACKAIRPYFIESIKRFKKRLKTKTA